MSLAAQLRRSLSGGPCNGPGRHFQGGSFRVVRVIRVIRGRRLGWMV